MLTTLNSKKKKLTEEVSKLSNDELDSITMTIMDAWNHNNFICKNYILIGLNNTLYDVYSLIRVQMHFEKL